MAHRLQSRFRLLVKGLRFAAITGGFAAVLMFFFYDGPLRMPQWLPTAEAVEASQLDDGAVSTVSDSHDAPQSLMLPSGFQAQWRVATLDGAVTLRTLERRFTLAQTEGGVGSEAYDYAASLFEQAGKAIPEQGFSERLQALSLEAQTLGNSLRQATRLRYDAAPGADMAHLQVRSAILFQLNDLTTADHRPGPALSAFMAHVQALSADPAASQYPETIALLAREARLLESIGTHAQLHWESAQIDSPNGTPHTVNVKVYVEQTLPDRMLASAAQ